MPVNIFRQMFSDNIAEQYGLPQASVLANMFSQENKQGDFVRIDGLKANAALVTPTKDLTSRQDGIGDFATYAGILTPYTGSIKVGSYVSPETIEASDTIPKADDVQRAIDIKGRLVGSLTSSVWEQETVLAIAALGAASVLRDDSSGGKTNENMPASQLFTTGNVGYISPDDLDSIGALFANQYISDEKFLVVNPTQKAAMLKNNRDFFQNVDYIGSMGAFAKGDLEQAAGMTVISDPNVPAGEFYAFAKGAMTANSWTELDARIEELPTQRFATLCYIARDFNCVRNDDLGVVIGTIDS